MDHPESSKSCSTQGCQGVMWWATLLVAVLAVPCVGVIIASATHLHGIGGVVIFVLACWVSTYLGMRLMNNAGMSRRIGKD